MRRALNDNPVAQMAVLGVLAVLVGFFLLTRMSSNSAGDTSASSPAAPDASTAPALADGAGTPAVPSPATGTTPPATGSDEALAPPASPSDASAGEFVAGPGLPAAVVKAYKGDKTVVLLVLRHRGIDDDQLREHVERQRGRSEVALFVTNAAHIARYSRITQGVKVDRVPALIVLRPRHLAHGTPTASVSYGFRGPESVDQAVSDALYKGPRDLPYYPK